MSGAHGRQPKPRAVGSAVEPADYPPLDSRISVNTKIEPWSVMTTALFWSRRRESNPPKSAWEADAIPIGDACN